MSNVLSVWGLILLGLPPVLGGYIRYRIFRYDEKAYFTTFALMVLLYIALFSGTVLLDWITQTDKIGELYKKLSDPFNDYPAQFLSYYYLILLPMFFIFIHLNSYYDFWSHLENVIFRQPFFYFILYPVLSIFVLGILQDYSPYTLQLLIVFGVFVTIAGLHAFFGPIISGGLLAVLAYQFFFGTVPQPQWMDSGGILDFLRSGSQGIGMIMILVSAFLALPGILEMGWSFFYKVFDGFGS